MALRLKANRRFPSVPVVTDNTENHTQVLMAVKEALDIGQRRTGDLFNSFIRVEDLIDLGLITIEGNTNAIVGADLSEIANIGDLSGSALGDFLRFDGTDWINDQLSVSDITQPMVTQHQAALSIGWAQLTGVPALGEVNTAANIGAGEGVFATKVGVELRFKSLIEGDNIELTSDGDEITISTPTRKYLEPVANGDPVNPEALFADGDFVFVERDVF